ncbi:MAG TPA: hypothetical protein VI434_06675 [Candidatus Dormibacteraeota bacterium]
MTASSFDFWIGEWDVHWTDADGVPQSGTNSVARVDETIRELFCAPEPDGPYIGASMSRWNDDAGEWVQDYWDNRGYAAVFRGSHGDAGMVLERTSQPATGAPTRLVWSDITADAITWNYERRTDSGAWESMWRILYRRRDTKGSAPPI